MKGKKRKRGDDSKSTPHSISCSLNSVSKKMFLTSQDGRYFEEQLREHYNGFEHFSVDKIKKGLHQKFKLTLERLRDSNYYHYDIVFAGGKLPSRTFVKRTLVGEQGITYKYLGLRLFAHPWSGSGATPLLRSIGEMNQTMIEMTKKFNDPGLYEYNLTLINYMEPTTHTSVGFKEDPEYGLGKFSVSWHADSSCEPSSSIGVYHCLPTQRCSKWDWKIALRTNDKKTKPVVIDTKDGDAYFLLKDFNETHQHSVIAGSLTNRISSTHRVAVTREDTYDYILKRCKIARKRFRLAMENVTSQSIDSLDAKVVRYCQIVLTEVENEWIAQYFLQGSQHDMLHKWWQRPMKVLETYWLCLEEYTFQLYNHICAFYGKNNVQTSTKTDLLPKVLMIEFQRRQQLRQQWDERRAMPIYRKRLTQGFHPIARPEFNQNNGETNMIKRLPKNLSMHIKKLTNICSNSGFSLEKETVAGKPKTVKERHDRKKRNK